MPARPYKESESGVALLAVLLGLIVISVLVLGLVLATRVSIDEAHSNLQTSRARAWNDAVILQTAVSLMDTSNSMRPRIDGVPQSVVVLGHNATITITSEFGKVDLNAADQGTLTNLLEAAGVGPAIATEEAGQIVNWRNGGSGTTELHPFRSVEELTQVAGIIDIYGKIAPAITVFSGRGQVDNATAPLLALEAAGMDAQTAQSFIHARDNNENTNSYGEVINGQLQPGTSITGWAFQIQADFIFGATPEHVSAVIRMTGDPTHPYLVLARNQLPE